MSHTTIRTFLGIGIPEEGTTLSDAKKVVALNETKPVKYLKFMDITSFPALKGEPESIDATTMSNTQRIEKNGLLGAMSGDFGSYFDRKKYEEARRLIKTNGRDTLYHWCLFFEDSKAVFDWIGSFDIGIGEGEIAAMIPVTVHTSVETEPDIREGYNGEYTEATETITVTEISA